MSRALFPESVNLLIYMARILQMWLSEGSKYGEIILDNLSQPNVITKVTEGDFVQIEECLRDVARWQFHQSLLVLKIEEGAVHQEKQAASWS